MKAPNVTKEKLTVCVNPNWPFHINTLNGECEVVFSREMPAHSSQDRSLDDVLSCRFFRESEREKCSAANHRAVADEVLRAAAPLLAEALNALLSHFHNGSERPLRDLMDDATVALKQAGYED